MLPPVSLTLYVCIKACTVQFKLSRASFFYLFYPLTLPPPRWVTSTTSSTLTSFDRSFNGKFISSRPSYKTNMSNNAPGRSGMIPSTSAIPAQSPQN